MVKTDMVFFWVIVLHTLTGNHSEDALFHLALWPTTVEKKAENEHSQRHDQDSFIINDILQCKMFVLRTQNALHTHRRGVGPYCEHVPLKRNI
jgi:hypothetical protein